MNSHLKRLSWPLLVGVASLLIAGIVGISFTNIEVIIFKFLVFCPAVMLVHLTRKVLFPYIDLEELIHTADTTRASAAAVIGVFLFYVGCIYALTQAI
jgi:hypothetical protein